MKLTVSGLIRKGPRHKKPQIETVRTFVRELTSSPSESSAPIKDQDGRALPTQEEREHLWVEHLKGVQNQPAPTTAFDPSLLDPIPDLPTNLDTIIAVETKNVIWALRNSKARTRSCLNYSNLATSVLLMPLRTYFFTIFIGLRSRLNWATPKGEFYVSKAILWYIYSDV